MTVKLAGALPKEDTGLNGAEQLHEALLARPTDCHLVVALVRRSALAINDKTKAQDPTVECLEIEVLTGGQALDGYRMLAETRRARVRTDREPTGGLFGDPIAETTEKLTKAVQAEHEVDAGER